MSKFNVVTFKAKPALWKDYGELVEALKELGVLKTEESRATLINDFITCFVIENKKRLENIRERKELKEGWTH